MNFQTIVVVSNELLAGFPFKRFQSTTGHKIKRQSYMCRVGSLQSIRKLPLCARLPVPGKAVYEARNVRCDSRIHFVCIA